MSKARDLADIASDDVIATTASGVDVIGTISVVGPGASGTGTQISSGTATADTRFKARTESWNGIVSVYDSGGNEDVRISASSGVNTYFNSGSNVGIGTSSPARRLTVKDSIPHISILANVNTQDCFLDFGDEDDDNRGRLVYANSDDSLAFYTAAAEAMRLDASGNVLVGTTSLVTGGYAARFNVQTAANTAIFKCTAAAGGGTSLQTVRDTDGGQIVFHQGGSAVGSISSTASGVIYSTTSDRRLKDNIKPIADATDKLMSMKPVTHTWIADPQAEAVVGFIAQEMQEIVPEAVTGNPDSEEMMSMDYGRITPVLVAALQDAVNEIKALKQRVSELEAK
jgi:hypothetical protein